MKLLLKAIIELLSSKDFSNFEQLITTIIEKEQYDFSELEELEKRKKKYRLANSYDEMNSTACEEQPLHDLTIPEITKEESRRYGRFKIKIVSYG